MLSRLSVIAGLAVVLASCGGDSPTAPAPTPVPTPTPVLYSGPYGGPMRFTSTSTSGGLNVTGTTRVTHSGGSVTLANLALSFLGEHVTTFPLGPAPFDGATFEGSVQYQSSGCGAMVSRYKGYFGANGSVVKMNLQVTLAPLTTKGDCAASDVRGELTRG